MKKIIIVSIALAGMAAQANTLNYSGLRAKAIFRIASILEITDCGMGQCEIDMEGVSCQKVVDDNKQVYYQQCTIASAYDGEIKNLTFGTQNPNDQKSGQAQELRTALSELTGLEKTVSPTQKSLTVKSVKCSADGLDHELDALAIEEDYNCTIETN